MDFEAATGPARPASPPFDNLDTMVDSLHEIHRIFYARNPKSQLRAMLYVVFANGNVVPMHPYMATEADAGDGDDFAERMRRLCEAGKVVRYAFFHEVSIPGAGQDRDGKTSSDGDVRKNIVVTIGFERDRSPVSGLLEIVRDEETGDVVRLDRVTATAEVDPARFDFFT